MKESKLTPGLAIAVLGVVYGDIGTSPLYSLKESFHHTHNLPVTEANVLGVLSLIFWSLILIISLKYNVLILKAHNKGEGGILALTTLISNVFRHNSRRLKVLTLLGIFGTALLYGDGVITPAISVLSAVEGLELIRPSLHPYIVPITVVILLGLFSIQRYGTEVIGKVFGPVTLLWFLVLGLLGTLKIVDAPHVLWALNPLLAVDFFIRNGASGVMVLGSVFLVVTGGEALYSDLGHFGRRPINAVWFGLVLPCLFLNYFGQGALLIENPAAIRNPFYYLAPEWALLPLVILATCATVIASQALITGVFSLTMQAVQLQYLPRMKIEHTSHEEVGQIYVGVMNFLLMISCIALVMSFGSSTALAAAYGIAVTMTMLITTILFYFLARYKWKWSNWLALPLCGFFVAVELCYFGANLMKVFHGGWLTLAVGTAIFTVMTTWNRGRKILSERLLEKITPIGTVKAKLAEGRIERIPGVGVYLAGQPQFVPTSLISNLRHYRSLHEKTLILTVKTEDVPFVEPRKRATVKDVGEGIYKVQLYYGFLEVPNVPEALCAIAAQLGVDFASAEVTYFLGQEQLLVKRSVKGMAVWREKFFEVMSRNSQSASKFFNLPSDQVITIGQTIEL
jgi:KUP system potassium uptake protein